MVMDEQQFVRSESDKALENDPATLQAATMREDKISNILSQINPDNLLTDIEHRIRGEKKDFYGTWTKISVTSEPISEELVADFISFLGSILNQNTSMSNFKEQEINNMMEVIIDWIKNYFVVNADRYGIEGQYTEYDRIGHIILLTCFGVFKRALHGRESKRIFGMLRVSETSDANKGSKFTDNFKFWA